MTAPTGHPPRPRRTTLAIIREELARYRRLYQQATLRHRVAPGIGPDRRDRWYGAVRALERLLERLLPPK